MTFCTDFKKFSLSCGSSHTSPSDISGLRPVPSSLSPKLLDFCFNSSVNFDPVGFILSLGKNEVAALLSPDGLYNTDSANSLGFCNNLLVTEPMTGAIISPATPAPAPNAAAVP